MTIGSDVWGIFKKLIIEPKGQLELCGEDKAVVDQIWHKGLLINIEFAARFHMWYHNTGMVMSKIDKLIRKAQENPGTLKFSELVKLADHFGFKQVRRSGSHRIFSRGAGFRRFNFQEFHGQAKIAQVKEFVGFLEEENWI